MKHLILLAGIAAILAAVSSLPAFATCYYFQPCDKDLNELTHQEAYRWGINLTLPPNEKITSASLYFYSIYDWASESNWLYCSLLNDKPGHPFQTLKTFTDNEAFGNYFDGWAWGKTDLVTYTNLGTTPVNLTYNFTLAQRNALQSYLSDGNFAVAIDPDCHFYNDHVELEICTMISTMTVPEPSTMMLVVGGLVTAVGSGILRRRK
jgi:hypothetical protein